MSEQEANQTGEDPKDSHSEEAGENSDSEAKNGTTGADNNSEGVDDKFADYIEKRNRALRRLAFKHGADVAVYSARLERRWTDQLIGKVFEAPMTQKRDIVLAIQTNGGLPAAGYRLARVLQRQYKRILLLIFERCKSAGTLIALGADQIIMGPFAELGPLDVQRRKEGEIMLRSSVLDIQKSLYAINSYSLDFFANSLVQILRMGGNAITTERATNLASNIATDLLEPIASQIDPIRLGEDERKIEIARMYGKRLLPDGRDEELVYRFTDDYPSHGFVIDITEAKDIFGEDTVSEISEEERKFEHLWPEVRGDMQDPFVELYTFSSLFSQSQANHGGSDDGKKQEVQDETPERDERPDSTGTDGESQSEGTSNSSSRDTESGEEQGGADSREASKTEEEVDGNSESEETEGQSMQSDS